MMPIKSSLLEWENQGHPRQSVSLLVVFYLNFFLNLWYKTNTLDLLLIFWYTETMNSKIHLLKFLFKFSASQ